uniref:uncharacterized protein LOC120329835 n=1 Tax=Styela clava TaxID=7725 RepID=UPI0019393955|nr:uncharacterized protein LOC120329835 [Styela clava]
MISPIVSLILFLSLSIIRNEMTQEGNGLQLENVEDVSGENRAEVQTIPGKKDPKDGQESTNTFADATTVPFVPPTISLPPGFTEQDIVRYDGRIFIPLVSEKVYKASAISKCQQLGFELANIYNQIHMDKIMTFIRDNKLAGISQIDFHLGMTYDPINQNLRFQNGTVTSHSGFKWRKGSPYNGQRYSGWTNMFIWIQEDSTSRYQYIYNYPDSNQYVLCEV